MRKTDKKIDTALREALTEVCTIALDKYEGFQWLTHFANYSAFPSSLSIVCVFDTNAQLSAFRSSGNDMGFIHLIKGYLSRIDINLKDIQRHVRFDTEENCTKENNGKWNQRFQ